MYQVKYYTFRNGIQDFLYPYFTFEAAHRQVLALRDVGFSAWSVAL